MSEYNEHGYFANGLATPDQLRRYCGQEPPGKIVALGHAPPGILIFKKFLSPDVCQRLVEYANRESGTASTVQNTAAPDGAGLATRIGSERVTEYVDIGGVEEQAVGILHSAFEGQAAPHYGAAIEWFERPEILRYRTGGFYRQHADADNWDRTNRTWSRGMDRDISLLIYLNDDFTGGELEFSQFGYLVRPEAGMLVCFPSDHRYVHAARPTENGVRYVIVSWAAVAGSKRVQAAPPTGAIKTTPTGL